jgi:hypothetical protein
MKKFCYSCTTDKDYDAFYIDNSRIDGRQTQCKVCRKKYLKGHYKNNKSKYYEKAVKNRKNSAEKIKIYKNSQKCTDCEGQFPYWVTEFDHIGEKNFTIGASKHDYGTEKLLNEINMCDFVCRNCHFNRTYLRRSNPKRSRPSEVILKKNYIISIKNKPCHDCSNTFPHWVLQFDHLRDKIECISRAVDKNMSLDFIKEELRKCELVCCNCHANRTYYRSISAPIIKLQFRIVSVEHISKFAHDDKKLDAIKWLVKEAAGL